MGAPYNATADLLERNLKSPARVAFREAGRATTYGELGERANRAGNALRALGVQMEQRVLLCMLDTADFPAAFWGAMKAGIVPIPVNTLLTTGDYDYLLRDSRARVLIVSAALLPKLEPILQNQPFLQAVVVSGGRAPGRLSFDELLAQAKPVLETAPTTADDVAFWLYSSGSASTSSMASARPRCCTSSSRCVRTTFAAAPQASRSLDTRSRSSTSRIGPCSAARSASCASAAPPAQSRTGTTARRACAPSA